MHKGRPFAIEQKLRAFATNDLYSRGWAAKAYTMTIGTYAGSNAVFITNPIPRLTFHGFDPDFLGGEYRGALNGPPFTPLEVGFHFRLMPTGEQCEAWVQTWFNGQLALNEPNPGTNYIPYAFSNQNRFFSNPGGPFANQIRPTQVQWDPESY